MNNIIQLVQLQYQLDKWIVSDKEIVKIINSLDYDQLIDLESQYNLINQKSLQYNLQQKLSKQTYKSIRYLFQPTQQIFEYLLLYFFEKQSIDGLIMTICLLDYSDFNQLQDFISALSQQIQSQYVSSIVKNIFDEKYIILSSESFQHKLDYISYLQYTNESYLKQVVQLLTQITSENLKEVTSNDMNFCQKQFGYNQIFQILCLRKISKESMFNYIYIQWHHLLNDNILLLTRRQLGQDRYLFCSQLSLSLPEQILLRC